MSEFSVHSTSDTIPALKYCLILDGERIAGGKPDYRGNNHLISWSTRETYGPIDQLKAENARLRELAEKAWKAAEMLCQAWEGPCHADGVPIYAPCPLDERDELCVYGLIQRDLRELGIEMDE